METLLKKLKSKFLSKSATSIFFFLAFFLPGCVNEVKKSSPLPSEERQWMEKFFHDLLFVEGGVYTLWGSKPITTIALYHYTDEEWEELNNNLSPEDLKNCEELGARVSVVIQRLKNQ